MGPKSCIGQNYMKPFLLDQHYEVAVTQINLPHIWINVDSEEASMKLVTKWKSMSLNKGYYRTVSDVARGIQQALGDEVTYEHDPRGPFGKLILAKDVDMFVTVPVARALGRLSEDGKDIAPLLKILYG